MKIARSLMVAAVATALLTGMGASANAVAPRLTPPPIPADYQPIKTAKVSVYAPQGVNDQRGIIKLSNCSASLVKMDNSQMGDPALMLTNGHCMFGGSRFPKPGEVAVDVQANLSGSILDDNSKEVMSVRGDRILYGTMTGTDAALVRLNVTFQQIKDKTGIDALPFAGRGPKVGDALTVNSGYWKEIYRCPMIKQVYKLSEAGWEQWDSVRYRDNCGIKGGTSGSPVIDDKTGEVVAVNNTLNESGGKCTMNNPCEIDERGNVTYQKGANYGQQTWWFRSCWTNDRKIDLSLPSCRLPQLDGKPKPLPTGSPTATVSPTATSTPTDEPTADPTDEPGKGGEVAVTNDNYRDVIANSSKVPTIFIVGASWSRQTNNALPKFRTKLTADGNTWTLAYVDGALYKQAKDAFNIKGYPTIIAYSNGSEMTNPARYASGSRNQDQVNTFVNDVIRTWKNQH